MLEPAPVLTPEETTLFIAELQQRWREAGDCEKERLASVLDHWLTSVTESVFTSLPNEEAHGADATGPVDGIP